MYAHVQRLVSVVKTATVLGSVLPKSSVILCVILWSKGLNAKNIHKEMKCLTRKAVHNSVEKSSQERSKVKDDVRISAEVSETAVKTCMMRFATHW
jgi:hypothetical protein